MVYKTGGERGAGSEAFAPYIPGTDAEKPQVLRVCKANSS